jgi:hypothetical protein
LVLDELWARAFEIVRYGTASDLVHHGHLPPELVKGPYGLEPPADRLFEARSEEHAAALANEVADPLSHALGLQRSAPTLTASELEHERSLAARLDAAFATKTGLPLSKMAKLVGQLACLAGFQPHGPPPIASLGGFNCASEDTLVQLLSAVVLADASAVCRALRFLSIGPRPDYPSKGDMAWVYGRRRSFQSRPMVRHPDGSTLSWSGMHTYLCLDVICSQLSYNSLPGVEDRSELGRAMSALSTWRGQVFQKDVLDVARADFRLRAKRLTSLNGKPLHKPNGDPLGDIDALIAVPGLKMLLALEAKAIAPARTPRDFNDEIMRFRATGGERTDLDRHLMRVDFVRRNLAAALRELDLPEDDAQQWRLHAAIVTRGNPVAGLLEDCPVPVVSVATLRRLDFEDWARELRSGSGLLPASAQ